MRNIEFPSFAVFSSANKMILTISFLNIFFSDEKNGSYSMLLNSVVLVSQKLKSPFIFQDPGEFFLFSKGCVHTLVAERKWPSTIRAGQSTGNGSSWAARKRLNKIIERTRILMRQFLTKKITGLKTFVHFNP